MEPAIRTQASTKYYGKRAGVLLALTLVFAVGAVLTFERRDLAT